MTLSFFHITVDEFWLTLPYNFDLHWLTYIFLESSAVQQCCGLDFDWVSATPRFFCSHSVVGVLGIIVVIASHMISHDRNSLANRDVHGWQFQTSHTLFSLFQIILSWTLTFSICLEIMEWCSARGFLLELHGVNLRWICNDLHFGVLY